ncbi:MAG: hypothetical protein AAGE18_05405 [Pseudomonadota bacterium]
MTNYAGNREDKIDPMLSVGQEAEVFDALGPWNSTPASQGRLTSRFASSWHFNFTVNEAELMLRETEFIRTQQRSAAQAGAFTLVLGARDAFLDNNWAQGIHGNLPNSSAESWDPADWRPYRFEIGQRAIRTVNDSFVTQMNVDGDTRENDDEFPDYRGAAHPNLTGHRLLAEHVALCVDAVLRGDSEESCMYR